MILAILCDCLEEYFLGHMEHLPVLTLEMKAPQEWLLVRYLDLSVISVHVYRPKTSNNRTGKSKLNSLPIFCFLK